MRHLTATELRKANACPEALDAFTATWGESAPLDKHFAVWVLDLEGRVDWAEWLVFSHLCPSDIRAECVKARDTLWAEYEKASAPLWAECVKASAPLWAEYQKARAPLLAEYQKASAQLLRTAILAMGKSATPTPEEK